MTARRLTTTVAAATLSLALVSTPAIALVPDLVGPSTTGVEEPIEDESLFMSVGRLLQI